MPTSDWPELAGEAQKRWNRNAAFWDDYMGEQSNDFHNLLVRPAMERLLAVEPGDSVLDIACGNGNFSRFLAGLGARVTAIDGSSGMIERARARSEGDTEGDSQGDSEGPADGASGNESAGDIAGEFTGDVAGNTAGDTEGDTADGSSGDTAGDTTGDTEGDTADESAGDIAGNTADESAGDTASRIDYRVIDVTDTKALEELGPDTFDAVVSNMAVMDMAEVGPMFGAVHGLLKPGGVFVFSLTHPCFQAPYAVRYAEQVDQDGRMTRKVGIKIERYQTPQPYEGLAIVGQPVPSLIFHRPLSVLLTMCFEAGFVLDGIEERVFDDSVETDRELSWANFRETPPMMAVRLRRLA